MFYHVCHQRSTADEPSSSQSIFSRQLDTGQQHPNHPRWPTMASVTSSNTRIESSDPSCRSNDDYPLSRRARIILLKWAQGLRRLHLVTHTATTGRLSNFREPMGGLRTHSVLLAWGRRAHTKYHPSVVELRNTREALAGLPCSG